MTTDQWGIENGFEDALGVWHDTSDETRRAIQNAIGVSRNETTPSEPPVRVIRPGTKAALPWPADLTLEDGTTFQDLNELPPDLPLGYHVLQRHEDEARIELIVCPESCFLPRDLHVWGWAVQLYALRSAGSWGMGDLADLRALAEWSATELGARAILLNPLHAATPVLPQTPSPYFPSSRLYKNLLYLRIEDIPGARDLGSDLEPIAKEGRALNPEPRIQRDTIFRLKLQALQKLWLRFKGDSAFDQFILQEGEYLTHFAIFCALAQRFGKGWRRWPSGYRRPLSLDVARFAKDSPDLIRFFQWIQWRLDIQLAGAGSALALMQDLPIGVDPEGADAWIFQDALALDMRVGAPPDEFNTLGQDWGLPPFVPHKLRQTAYRPFRQTIRATLRHSGGLRIDHVMGLFRLFWIPNGMDPSQGAYVRYPAEDLLAILSLESMRAKAFVVGEDLGTVEQGVPEQLARHRILSYKVFWFEPGLPSEYPALSLAAVTTHDLPTIAGLWSGSDLEAQRRLGLNPNEEGIREILQRIRKLTRVPRGAESRQVIKRTYRLLAKAPSAIVTASLEDALGVETRPNMPSTVDEWPNWSIPLPVPLEEMKENPSFIEIARVLRQGRKRKNSGLPQGRRDAE